MVIGDEVANREMYQFTLMYLPRPHPPQKKKKTKKDNLEVQLSRSSKY